MYFVLTQAIKQKFIETLRKYYSYHPKFRDDLVPNIKGEYRFDERPQIGMTIRSGSGNHIQLSPDNFVATIRSYVTMARFPEKPGLFLEWVREDNSAIAGSRSFPSPPGVYFIEITEHDPTSGRGQFFVDPMLDVRNEVVDMVSETEGILVGLPIEGTLRLYELPANRLLTEGVDYEVDETDLKLFTLSEAINPQSQDISADYRTQGVSTGPWDFVEQRANNKAIPGAVLAFGRRVELGDTMAVIVYARREPAYMEYGGKWNVPIEIEIVSRDSNTRAEVADQTAIYLFGIARSWLVKEGIEIIDVGIGGESEDMYDSGGGEDSYYFATVSVTVETDWAIHVPLDLSLRSFEEVLSPTGDLLVLSSDPSSGLQLDYLTDPYYRGRKPSTEGVR